MNSVLKNSYRFILTLAVLSLIACSSSTDVGVTGGGIKKPDSNANVTLVAPKNNTTSVPVSTNVIKIDLSNVDSSTFNKSNITFSPAIAGTVVQMSATEIEYQISSVLTTSTKYSITVSGLKSTTGQDIAQISWSFTTIAPVNNDCSSGTVLCVDDTAGVTQEYSTIQLAVDVSQAGDTILVHDGSYAGFRVSRSGTFTSRITIKAVSANVFLTSSEGGGSSNEIRVNNASYVTVEGFTINRPGVSKLNNYDYACVAARGATVGTPMESLIFINNHMKGCSPAGMYLSNVNNLKIERNIIENSVLTTTNVNGNGIYLSNAGTKNAKVLENKILNNAGAGIHFNGDISVGGDGIQTGHFLTRNVIIGNGNNGFNMDGVRDSRVINNIFAKNGRHGIRGFRIDAAKGPGNMVIANNTFYSNGSSATKFSEGTGGHVVFNNLLISNVTNSFVIADQFSQSNNLIGTNASFFTNASGNVFTLTAGTAAINGGVASFSSIMAPSIDLSSSPRTGLPDLGAFELGNSYPAWY